MTDGQGVSDQIGRALDAFVRPGVDVLDVGGGSGTHAVPLAIRGCRVTVVDPSVDALAILRRRASEAGVAERVRGIQSDADAIGSVVTPGSADLVLCHHVLESVDDPDSAVAAMAAALVPGGTLSLLVPGRHAQVLALSVAGRFAEARVAVDSPDGRFGSADPLQRRYDAGSAERLLVAAGLTVRSVRGIGVVTGLVPGAVLQTQFQGLGELGALEDRLSATPSLRDIAADLHLLADRRP